MSVDSARATLTTFFESIVNHSGSSITRFSLSKLNDAVRLTLEDGRELIVIDGSIMVNNPDGVLGTSVTLGDDPDPRLWTRLPKSR